MSNKTNAAINQISIITQILVDFMRTVENESVLNYEQLEQIAGCQIRPGSKGYHYLTSAKRILQRDFQKTFIPIPKEGLQLADNSACISIGHGTAKSLRRKADRGIRALGCCKPSEMTNEQMISFNAIASQLGAIRIISNHNTTKRLEAAVAVSKIQLPLKQTLSAFMTIEETK